MQVLRLSDFRIVGCVEPFVLPRILPRSVVGLPASISQPFSISGPPVYLHGGERFLEILLSIRPLYQTIGGEVCQKRTEHAESRLRAFVALRPSVLQSALIRSGWRSLSGASIRQSSRKGNARRRG